MAARMRYMPTKLLKRHITVTSQVKPTSESYKFVVVGGGAGGLSVASHLARTHPNQVAVVEPSTSHYYQPMWTLVGAGLKNREDTKRPMSSVMPKNVDWKKAKVVGFDPENNFVATDAGHRLQYEILVVALGLQLDFYKLPGLTEALGTEGVGCNYSYDTVMYTRDALKKFKGGNAFFTLPATPVKCLGAPQKIMYLADEIFRKNGVRDKTNIVYKTPGGVLFAVEKYRNSLLKVCAERDIKIDYFKNLVSIDSSKKQATFQFVDDENEIKKRETLDYDFIHVTPPMGPVDALRATAIVDDTGFVDVHRETCQHVKYPNIFSLGDCSNLPVSKTAAAVGAQSEVVRQNLTSFVNGKKLTAKYTGYASCPLVTSSKKCILAEFDYTGQPRETFPVDQGQERTSMYYMKTVAMPEIYWNLLLK